MNKNEAAASEPATKNTLSVINSSIHRMHSFVFKLWDSVSAIKPLELNSIATKFTVCSSAHKKWLNCRKFKEVNSQSLFGNTKTVFWFSDLCTQNQIHFIRETSRVKQNQWLHLTPFVHLPAKWKECTKQSKQMTCKVNKVKQPHFEQTTKPKQIHNKKIKRNVEKWIWARGDAINYRSNIVTST